MKPSLFSPSQEREVREFVKLGEEEECWKIWNKYRYRLLKESRRAKRGEFDASITHKVERYKENDFFTFQKGGKER